MYPLSYRLSQNDLQMWAAMRLADAIRHIAAVDDPGIVITALQPHRELAGQLNPVTKYLCNKVTMKLVGHETTDHCFPLVLLDRWAKDPEVSTTDVLDLLGSVLADFPEGVL